MARWSDPYGKGWEQGRKDAIRDIHVAITRARPTLSVVMEREYLPVEDVLDLVEHVDQPHTHPERTEPQ
jgi:hypothetical protein